MRLAAADCVGNEPKCGTVGGGSPDMIKKILTWGGLAFLVFFIAYRPNEASGIVGQIASSIGDVAQGFGDFVAGVVM